jgi:hypothetical protein
VLKHPILLTHTNKKPVFKYNKQIIINIHRINKLEYSTDKINFIVISNMNIDKNNLKKSD